MKLLKRFFLFLFVFLVVIGGFFIKSGYDKYKECIADKPLTEAVEEIKSKKNYTVYADIPKVYFEAVVAVEDRRFYTHNGFDFIGTARAIYRDIKAKEVLEGGSTITQQLAKNMYFPMYDTIDRKIAEIFIALEIEKNYGKTEILELYVNGIYYGSGYYCIYDASQGYFDKKPSKMTVDECTLLAGIPNAPSVYSLDVNPDLARDRQQDVIEAMKKCGYMEE